MEARNEVKYINKQTHKPVLYWVALSLKNQVHPLWVLSNSALHLYAPLAVMAWNQFAQLKVVH